jgi:hypothetical protein
MLKTFSRKSKDESVTLEEAVAILNARKHRGHSSWYVSGSVSSDAMVFGKDQYETFEPFEAIAIAEKYQSELTKPSLGLPRSCQ